MSGEGVRYTRRHDEVLRDIAAYYARTGSEASDALKRAIVSCRALLAEPVELSENTLSTDAPSPTCGAKSRAATWRWTCELSEGHGGDHMEYDTHSKRAVSWASEGQACDGEGTQPSGGDSHGPVVEGPPSTPLPRDATVEAYYAARTEAWSINWRGPLDGVIAAADAMAERIEALRGERRAFERQYQKQVAYHIAQVEVLEARALKAEQERDEARSLVRYAVVELGACEVFQDWCGIHRHERTCPIEELRVAWSSWEPLAVPTPKEGLSDA